MAKGQNFERDMCRAWSLWASSNESNDWFWRTPQSGGKATERAKKGLTAADYAGDMMSICNEGRVLTEHNYFEFKRGYTSKKKEHLSILNCLDNLSSNKEPLLIQWWRKLEKERKLHRKQRGFLIFKRDRKETCIVMSSKTYLFQTSQRPHPNKWLTLKYGKIYLVVVQLEDFFRDFKVDRLCELPSGTGRTLKCRRKPKTIKLKIRRKKNVS